MIYLKEKCVIRFKITEMMLRSQLLLKISVITQTLPMQVQVSQRLPEKAVETVAVLMSKPISIWAHNKLFQSKYSHPILGKYKQICKLHRPFKMTALRKKRTTKMRTTTIV